MEQARCHALGTGFHPANAARDWIWRRGQLSGPSHTRAGDGDRLVSGCDERPQGEEDAFMEEAFDQRADALAGEPELRAAELERVP